MSCWNYRKGSSKPILKTLDKIMFKFLSTVEIQILSLLEYM